jgi:hypothetical protein
MAFPALACGGAIERGIKPEDQPRSIGPVHAGRVGIKQFGVNRKVLPIIACHLTAWRHISQHKKLQM